MMAKSNPNINPLQRAKLALRQGDRLAARRWAELAAAQTPDHEEPWLILAALASPKASVVYIKQALEINPRSQAARKGMHWAVQRYRHSPKPPQPRRQLIAATMSSQALTRPVPAKIPWAILILVIVSAFAIWFGTPDFSQASAPGNVLVAAFNLEKSTATPTPTATSTPTPTFTPTPTPTNTPTPTPTFTPTSAPTETPTPKPTKTSIPPTKENKQGGGDVALPPGVSRGEHWIDVDLTNQRLAAYQGKNLINRFVVSTGTWRTPTVTGQYKIYVKYPYADMSGPGYYLAGVPNVMYFYKGYGIHGTYWHSNFGTPMSHGCINLSPSDSAWVYNFSEVGTIVNIHY